MSFTTKKALLLEGVHPCAADTFRSHGYDVNTPGVLKDINDILSEHNIRTQLLGTTNEIGYLIADVDAEGRERNDILGRVSSLEHSIKTRVLN
jgi:D-3-phosphoglycerate dehydrogenase